MKDRSKVKIIINAALFQIGWFTAILMGSSYSLALLPILLAIHYFFIASNTREWISIFAITLIGVSLDTAFYHTGVFMFPEHASLLIPFWLICLWLFFATTVNHCLEWLTAYPVGAVLLGAIGGGASYYAGQKLGAVNLSEYGVLFVSAAWAVLMPLFFWLNQKITPDRKTLNEG